MTAQLSEGLNYLFNPQSIAIIGASSREGSVGRAALDNSITAGFPGKLWPINPRAASSGQEILGIKAYASVLDVPEKIDLAVIIVPAKYVPQVMEDIGKKGIPVCIIISAGFKEIGPEGAELEEEVKKIARKYSIRVLGPHTLGITSTAPDNPFNVSFASQKPIPGRIAFASQSGAFLTSILDWSLERGIGFSSFVSLGNKMDIDETHLLEYWENDPNTSVVLAYLESINNGQKFMEVARRVTAKKPVIIVKSGGTDAGARASASHTGSLAGADEAYTSAFEQSGVMRAFSSQELFDLAAAFLQSPPKSDGETYIALVTNAGGPGIMATDAVERSGLHLSDFHKDTISRLREVLPAAASVYNPIDVIGDAPPQRFKDTLEAIIPDDRVHGIIVIVTPQAMTDPPTTAQILIDATKTTEKPIFACMMGGAIMDEAAAILMKNGVPSYSFPEQAVRAMRGLADFQVRRRHASKVPKLKKTEQAALDHVKEVISRVKADGRVVCTEAEAKEIVQAYNFPMAREGVATTPEEAAQVASEIGFPVVMKILSPDILHKTDVGGVKLNIQTPQAAAAASVEIINSCRKYLPEADLRGVLVAEMVKPGKEIILGMVRDPQFGPLLMFGLGGIYVEVLKDVSFKVAPITKDDAMRMMESIRSYSLLRGVRGEPPSDLAAMAEVLLKMSQLSLDFPEIVEMDVNPLFAYPEGCLALDVKITLE